MHRLVQEVIRQEMTNEGTLACLRLAFQLLNRYTSCEISKLSVVEDSERELGFVSVHPLLLMTVYNFKSLVDHGNSYMTVDSLLLPEFKSLEQNLRRLLEKQKTYHTLLLSITRHYKTLQLQT